jgi:tetratricopeptide (TPR) repeat protein
LHSAAHQRNWQYALVDFNEMLKFNPDHSEARLHRGRCYFNMRQYQEAIVDFSVAIHLNPLSWQAYFYRGCCFRK